LAKVSVAELLILVDENDRAIGSVDKLEAHRTGARHRAVSVFVFDAEGRVLLQRRANDKYHSGGKWANTCCTHPRPGESTADAASRRLREEMGIECELTSRGVFTYRCEVGSGLIEHEIDHVFVGRSNELPHPNSAEVQEYRWISVPELARELDESPTTFVPWMRMAFEVSRSNGAMEPKPL
jgi:isopentenyl-diphosphate delta-isomerase